MTSMTGYAYQAATFEEAELSVEIRSVNSRFLDLNINLPPYLNSLEQRIREAAGQQIVRGKVDITFRIKERQPDVRILADTGAATEYARAIKAVAQAIGAEDAALPLALIVSQPGVLIADKNYDAEKYWKMIEPLFFDALNQFTEDRKREGRNLYADIAAKLDTLDSCAAFFKQWQPTMESRFKEQLRAKFHELLGERADEQLIMNETAVMLVKYTINEEIVRLESHLAALRAELSENPAPGKKMDFICQEINREINTIGSKNQFVEVGNTVITAKDALENIREQSRNVE